MEYTAGSDNYFRTYVVRNSKLNKVLFFHTSYGFPWWVYYLQIHMYRYFGYEVVVYDYSNKVLDNEDPKILPMVVEDVVKDMKIRVESYESRGIKIFHGIGNSLGSYFVYNYALRNYLAAIMLNAGGSVSDIIFHNNKMSYKKQGYDKAAIDKLWSKYDSPELGQNIHTEKTLITLSRNDKTIPPESSRKLVESIQASQSHVVVKYDSLPHVASVVLNSWRLFSISKFFNN